MGQIDFFSINLNKQVPIYFCGESLSGTLDLRINERLKLNSIKMNICGLADVRWTETHTETTGSGNNRRSRTRTSYYNGKELYINFDLLILAKQADKELYLEMGSYSYPFNVVLPQNLPTSFEHFNGKIRYSLTGIIDIPWAFDKYTVRTFSVISHLDLNANPILRQPQGSSAIKTFLCGPCKSDPLTVNLTIPKTGYVPGEPVFFKVVFDNKTNKNINDVTLYLNQYIQLQATNYIRTKTDFRSVVALKYPEIIKKKTTQQWEAGFVIPPVCSSSNGTSRLININYTLFLKFGTSGLSFSSNIEIPIVVGTIPLSDVNAANQQNMPIGFQPSMFETDPSQNTPERGEVVESDENNFKPMYPYYKDFSLKQ